MCYSHFGNGVRNGAISITQWGFINDRYKGKNSGNGMGFVDPCLSHLDSPFFYVDRKIGHKGWCFAKATA